jgi:hypothetical protein
MSKDGEGDPFYLKKIFVGSRNALLIGPLDERHQSYLQDYQDFLWIADTSAVLKVGVSSDGAWDVIDIGKKNIAEIKLSLQRFLRKDARHLPSIFVTSGVIDSSADNEPVYAASMGVVFDVFDETHRSRVTRQEDAFSWQSHFLQNAEAFLKAPLPREWGGLFKGIPAFVVGAGPSLDVSLGALAVASERGLIIASDSVLRKLVGEGVRVDICVSIDVAKNPDQCLPDGLEERALFVFSPVSPPEWQRRVPPSRRWYAGASQVTMDWLIEMGAERPAVAAVDNCGATAIELAAFLGCEPVCLFGMDLAVDSQRKGARHFETADELIYANSGYKSGSILPLVRGNYEEQVPAFDCGDLRRLGERLASRKHPIIFNINDRGAHIEGTRLVHPADFKNQFPFELTEGISPLNMELLLNGEHVKGKFEELTSVLREVSRKAVNQLPRLKKSFKKGGGVVLAADFRKLLQDQNLGRFLGTFSLKLMPHLVPPIEITPSLWESLLLEYEKLVLIAKRQFEK